MSKLNKVITDQTVELTPAEVAVLSSTLLPVVEAIGGGGEGPDLTDYVRKESFQPVSAAVTAMQEVSSKGPAAYEVLTAYSAEGTWLTEHQSLDGKQDKLTFNKNASNELTGIDGMPIAQPNVSNFLTKSNADTYYQPLPAAGIGYVTSSTTVIEGTAQYGLTTAGWTVIQGGGGSQGGIESVSHDTTMSGNGNGTPLGVVTGTTMASALSAGVAEGLTDGTSTSALSDFVTALAGKQAAGNYVSADDLADYQTTAAMANYYTTAQTSGAEDIAAALLLKADASTLASYLTKSDAQATYQTQLGMASYLTTAKYSTDSGTFLTAATTAGSISGNGTSTAALGLKTSAENALTAVANKIDTPVNDAAVDQYRIWNTLTSAWLGLNDAIANEGVICYSDLNSYFISEHGISAAYEQRSGDDDYRYYYGLTTTAYNAITSVSSKLDSTALTVNTANNEITLATGPSTSASVSAVNYKKNYSEALLVPQRLVVATSDDDITDHINYYSDSQYGTIIFVTSAHTNN